jgi:pyroglutamyl-peptidase
VTRVVLASFEPFGGHAANSSLEVGRALARRPPRGVELDWVVLPVVADACADRAWARIEHVQPDLVLALGQAAGADRPRLEVAAANVSDFLIPDNAGNLLRRRPVVPSGPGAYRCTARFDHAARELGRRGVPFAVSRSAGAYVCNHLFYALLHRAAAAGHAHQTGFVHLPLFAGQVRRQGSVAQPLDRLAEVIRVVISACVDESVIGQSVNRHGAEALPGRLGS